MFSVRGDTDRRVVVTEVFGGKGRRAVGENYVVLGETFFYGGGRGEHQDFTHAELKLQNVAILGGEGLQDSIHWLFYEVKMAYQWK